MKLTELDPAFKKVVTPGRRYASVDTFAEAHGVLFLCPKCFKANGGPEGSHQVFIWFEGCGAPEQERPKTRWKASGTELSNLTLSPSIHFGGGCGWHGFIRNGNVTNV